MDYFSEIINEIIEGTVVDKDQLQKLKSKLARKYKLPKLPTDADILQTAGKDKELVRKVLQKKPSRTMSGVSVVAVMTEPAECPHGKCIYCPGGYEVNTPQSYTGHEPAAMRGIQYDFNPYQQVNQRIRQLGIIGHPTDKIELIIMGGTFTSRPIEYQTSFVKGCFDAMNERGTATLKAAQIVNESAKHRCVGLTVETRPDYCKKEHIDTILDFGATRVELGVQNPDNRLYKLTKRGHTVKDVIDSTKWCRDSFLKVNYHLMPGLPGSDEKQDLEMFKKVFEDPRFKPDMLKIYPCLLIDPEYGKTELYEMYKEEKFKPINDEQATKLIAKAKKYFPKWVRVMRIQRDIPSKLILAGVKHSNLRQMVDEEMKKHNWKCNCIRCREIKNEIPKEVKIKKITYEAGGGTEVFISLEDTKQDKLIGFTRLRIPSNPFRLEITRQSAGIRELHVYGPSLEVGKKPGQELQHRGYGLRLLHEAEMIAAEEYDKNKMLVMSGVGVRGYYKNLGYSSEGAYMSKRLK